MTQPRPLDEDGVCDPAGGRTMSGKSAGRRIERNSMGRTVTRRDVLRGAGAGLAGLSLASVLSACARGEPAARGGFDWGAQSKTGQFTFANWPFYIDKQKQGGEATHPSLDLFTKQTGIDVNYLEVIDDYPSWFAKLQPQLAAGRPTGYDAIMMGYPRWFPQMIELGYLIPLDDSLLPNFRKYAAEKYKDPSFDPGHAHGIAFQSGATGIGYDPELTGREITSIMDLFDPAFKGRVGMFNDTEDLPNLTLLGMGIEPKTSTPADWDRAAELLRRQREDGVVRQYYGQGYIGDLQSGNVALTMAWSPDIFQSNISGYPNLKFVVPDEGSLLWTDYICIPIGAEHPLDAITYMDFIYKPDAAALLTAGIGAISPVPEAQEVLRQQGETEIAESPLVFPTQDMYARLHEYRILSPDEQRRWDDTFIPIVEG